MGGGRRERGIKDDEENDVKYHKVQDFCFCGDYIQHVTQSS